MKPKLEKKFLILYLGYNDMVKKTSHAIVPLRGMGEERDPSRVGRGGGEGKMG
jgi:hypothetical protein